MDRQDAWSMCRVVYGRPGAFSLYERKAADPRQDRAWLGATNYELLANRGELIRTFRGVVEGEILEAPRGTEGFGYDPLSYYPSFGGRFRWKKKWP